MILLRIHLTRRGSSVRRWCALRMSGPVEISSRIESPLTEIIFESTRDRLRRSLDGIGIDWCQFTGFTGQDTDIIESDITFERFSANTFDDDLIASTRLNRGETMSPLSSLLSTQDPN